MVKNKVMLRLVVDAVRSPMNALRWSCTLICNHEKWVTARSRPRSTQCDECEKSRIAEQLASGALGECRECHRNVRLRIPQGKFHPGDGTYRLTIKHKNGDAEPCKGSGEAAINWGFRKT